MKRARTNKLVVVQSANLGKLWKFLVALIA